MPSREAVAFLSYVRSDDAHDFGRITELRQSLEGEIKMQTGQAFHIFQDRNDISWGEQWKARIENALHGVTFLIPIVTPSYFQSPACRSEFHTFLIRERELGEERLILPIYYVSCDEMDATTETTDEMVSVLRARNWTDWRGFRFNRIDSPEIREQLAILAITIKSTIKTLESIFATSQSATRPPEKLEHVIESPIKPQPPVVQVTETLTIPAIRPSPHGVFDKENYQLVINNHYYAYTTFYDEVIIPSELVPAAETMELHSRLLANIVTSHCMNER
jgi:cobaltochelatase CobT